MLEQARINVEDAGFTHPITNTTSDTGYGNENDLRNVPAASLQLYVATQKSWKQRKLQQESLSPRGCIPAVVNHIPAGKPEPPTITPARDVTITVALPDFLRNVTACEVTENGIVPFDCSIREDQAILKMDAIESGRVFILRHLQ